MVKFAIVLVTYVKHLHMACNVSTLHIGYTFPFIKFSLSVGTKTDVMRPICNVGTSQTICDKVTELVLISRENTGV